MPVVFDADYVLGLGTDVSLPFFLAVAERGDWSALRSLIDKSGLSLGERDRKLRKQIIERTAKCIWEKAPREEVLSLMDFLAAKPGCDKELFVQEAKDFSPLCSAVRRNDRELVSRVLSNPSFDKEKSSRSSQKKTDDFRVPIEAAAQCASPEIIRMLETSGGNDWKIPPILLALLSERPLDVVEELLSCDSWTSPDFGVSDPVTLPQHTVLMEFMVSGGTEGMTCHLSPMALAYHLKRHDCLSAFVAKSGPAGLAGDPECWSQPENMHKAPLGLWMSSESSGPEGLDELLFLAGGVDALERAWFGEFDDATVFEKICSRRGTFSRLAVDTELSEFDRKGSLLMTMLLELSLMQEEVPFEKMSRMVCFGAQPATVFRGNKSTRSKSMLDALILGQKVDSAQAKRDTMSL